MDRLRRIRILGARYETHEVPFGRTYKWHSEQIIVECDCGERFTLAATSTTTTCRCGADHGAIIRDIQQKREGRLSEKTIRPWLHDAQEEQVERMWSEGEARTWAIDGFERLREEENAMLVETSFEPVGSDLWEKNGVCYGREAALQYARRG